MAIVLTILKIIGITFLSILGLLLLVIFLVLFVPVRYEITAEKLADSDFEAKVKITWLLHLLNILAWYKEELFYRVRVTLIPIYKSNNLKKNKRNTAKEVKDDNLKETSSSESSNEINKIIDNKISTNDYCEDLEDIEDIDDFTVYRGNDIAYSGNTAETNIITDGLTSDNYNELDDELDDLEKISLVDKFFEFTGILIDLVFNIDNKLSLFAKKIRDIFDNIQYYIELISDERNRAFVSGCLKRLSYVLKHIAPKKIKGRLHIGLEDAYDMGKMLSIYSVLFPLIHDKIQLVPDYDNEIIEGNILVKGKIQLGILLWTAFRIYFNKDFRRLRKMMTRSK